MLFLIGYDEIVNLNFVASQEPQRFPLQNVPEHEFGQPDEQKTLSW